MGCINMFILISLLLPLLVINTILNAIAVLSIATTYSYYAN